MHTRKKGILDWWLSSGGDTPGVMAMVLSWDIDPLNRHIDINFNTGVYDGLGPVSTSSFQISLTGGTASAPIITSVTNNIGEALTGGENIIRVHVSFTGNADGSEIIEVKPSSATAINGNSPLLLNTAQDILSVTYHSIYQTVITYCLDEATPPIQVPAREYRANENQWVIDLDATGKLATSDVIYRLSKYGDERYHLLNWKLPGTKTLIKVGTGVWTRGTGFPPGSVYYLTGWVPSLDGVNYTLNVAGIFHATEDDVQNNLQFDYGTSHSDGNTSKLIGINPRLTDNTCSIGLNTGIASTLTGITTTENSTFLNDRVAGPGASHDFYYNGVIHDPTNFTANALPDQELVIGARKLANGTVSGITSRRVSCLIAGASMGDQAAALHTAELNFVAANNAVTGELITTDDGNQLTTDTPTDLTTD